MSSSSNTPWRVAIVGLGNVSTHQVAALENIPLLDLVAACDTDRRKAESVPSNVEFFANYNRLLANTSHFDVILISTPPHTHLELASKALRRGVAVLLEKPATLDLADFDRLSEQAESAQTFLAVAFHAMFALDLLYYLDRADEFAALGDLISFRCRFRDPYVENGKVLSRALSLGGSWLDSGINALSVLGKLRSPESFVVADSEHYTLASGDQKPINVRSVVEFRTVESECALKGGTIETDWLSGKDEKLTELRFQTGKLLLHHSKQSVFQMHSDGKAQLRSNLGHGTERLTNHYRGVFADLVRMLEAQRSNLAFARRLHSLLFSAIDETTTRLIADPLDP